jgi:hypothetical protein
VQAMTKRPGRKIDAALKAKIALEALQPPSSTQVCVIGNSYVGAIKKAYQSGEMNTTPYSFSFLASPGAEFHNIKIIDGEVNNIRFFDGATSKRVDDYGAVIVYGDMPLPADVLALFKRLPPDKYSLAVRKACLLNWLQDFTAYKLASALAARRRPRIFVLSRNYLVGTRVAARSERSDGVALIREMIRPASYIQTPELLVPDEGNLQNDIYSGSLNVLGEKANRAEQPIHHLEHLNLAGGKVMLAAIVDCLRAE